MLFMSSIQKAPSFFSKVFLAMLPRRRLVYWALGLPLLLMSGYLFVHYYVTPLRHIPWSRVHLLAAPLGELLLIFFLFDLYHRTKGRAWSNGFVFLFAFFLVNFVAALFLTAYYGTVTPDVPAVSKILLAAPFVLTALFTGTVVSFVIGFRLQLRRAWLDYSLGSRDGDEESDKKGKILTASALIGFFILGLALRLHNLDGFPPYVDEYIHTNWAFLVYSGQPAEWGRAFLTVNLPVYLSYLTFGVNLWAGRFPMVLINMLSIFPLYVLGSRINRQIGLICVALFTLSPWVIASSRTVRDYAVVPLIFYTAAVLLLALLEWEGLRLGGYIQKNKYRILLAAGILVYTVIDKTSILRIVLGVYGIFGVLALIKIFKKNISAYYKIAILLLGSGFFVFLLVQSRIIYRYLNSGTIFYRTVTTYWSTLIASDMHQWYFIGAIGYLVLLAGHFLPFGRLAGLTAGPIFLFCSSFSHFLPTFFTLPTCCPIPASRDVCVTEF
jgi:hypothetical protein